MKRTDIINHIIVEKGYTSYLELGTQNKTNNFNQIKAKRKVCVDPDPLAKADHEVTTDFYFNNSEETFDLIFIDALHEHKQCLKDFENALRFLNKGGCIVLHDMLPHNEEYTKPIWCGDVYKAGLEISQSYRVATFDGDHGVMVVFPENIKEFEEVEIKYDLDYLKEKLNATTHLNTIMEPFVFPDDLDSLVIEGTEDVKDFDEMTDEEIKQIYKNATGKKRVSSKTTREEMIEAILKLQ